MSAIPGALTALVTKVKLALPGVQVFDGPPTEEPDPDLLMIGYSPIALSVEETQDPAGLDETLEAFDVRCIASSWSGDLDPIARRARAFELVQAVIDLLDDNPRLDGAVARARVTIASVDQNISNAGQDCTIGFTVHVNAFRP